MKKLLFLLPFLLVGCLVQDEKRIQTKIVTSNSIEYTNSCIEARPDEWSMCKAKHLVSSRTVYLGQSSTAICDMTGKLYFVYDESNPILQDGITCKYEVTLIHADGKKETLINL